MNLEKKHQGTSNRDLAVTEPVGGMDIQSVISNFAIINSAISSPNVTAFILKFGKGFILPAVKARATHNQPIVETLAVAGGLVGWALKSPMIQTALQSLDNGISSGYVTPEMLEEIIKDPSILKQMLNELTELSSTQ